MKTETIKTPNFTGSIAKIVSEVRLRTCMDEIDADVLVEILQDSLNEYCTLLDKYYEEEYYIAISRARNSAYDEGFDDGYNVGYDNGYADCNAENH